MALLRGPSSLAAAVLVAAAACLVASPAGAQPLTQEEALALAFPRADRVERRTAYLEPDQLARVRELAGERVEVSSGIVTHYVALRDDDPVGVAYFDAHRVRTLDEVLMVVVGPDHRIRRVETVRFREPPEYEAPPGWLELFQGRGLDPDLSLKGEIPTMTGATLTAQAVTDATRRVLALHRVVAPLSSPGAGSR